MEAMQKYFNEMSDFVDETGKAIKQWSDGFVGKSDNPDEYLPSKNLKQIEYILIHDVKLAEVLDKMGNQLRSKNSEERREKLTLAYADILEDIFKG